ncbi:MAG: AAA family ATPase [Anaeromicrobium sp.]|uniref:AAA family ATPase n=1 Tax=Anaeromicrobium sp. TaxID=1929132 RepID=UPI0025E0795F|nr:AAA family ATPase [Anaeromicrobium sp.]MCT4595644.1 AAA family ATPase [Anaeromicrobium sp.]
MNKSKTIFIITGPCGVGKSTISARLAQSFEKSVHINGDLIYHMVVGGYLPPWKDNGELMRLMWSNVSDLTKNYLERSYDIVVDYIVFPEHLKYLSDLRKRSGIILKYVILMANEEVIRERDNNRLTEQVMGERAIEVLNEFREKKIEDRYIVDTSDKSIEEIVFEIKMGERFIV